MTPSAAGAIDSASSSTRIDDPPPAPPPPGVGGQGSHHPMTKTSTAAATKMAMNPAIPSPRNKDKKDARAKPRIIGFKERMEINEERARASAGKPDNIVGRKIAVVIVFALIIWCYYVFVGRLIVPMLQRRRSSSGTVVGSVGEGVGLLIGFNVLWAMFVWSYLRVILTKPGFAVDFVERESQAVVAESQAGTNNARGITYVGAGAGVISDRRPPPPTASAQQTAYGEPAADFSTMTPAQRIVFEHRRSTGELTMHSLDLNEARRHRDRERQEQASLAAPAAAAMDDDDGEDREPRMLDGPRNLWPAEIPVPGFVDLGTSPPPPPPPVDASDIGGVWRDSSDEFAPSATGGGGVGGRPRAGTQPTVSDVDVDDDAGNGGGVLDLLQGRRLSAMSSAQQHGSQAHLNPHANPYPPAAHEITEEGESAAPPPLPNPGLPSQQQQQQRRNDNWLDERPLPPFNPAKQLCQYCHIYKPPRCHHCRHCGTCVLAMDHHCPWIGQCVGWHNHKFFLIFCLWSTIFTLYVLVVFSVKMAQMGSVDGQMIALVVIAGFFAAFTTTMGLGHIGLITSALTTLESFSVRAQRDRERHLLQQRYGFFKLRTKRRLLKKWNRDYGDLKTEGNRWYVGPSMWEWRRTMGDSPWGWVLPIGRSKGDGLVYDQNPRFAADGRRRKREEWPEHLR